MNRDEARDRLERNELRQLATPSCQAAYPVDTRSDGTWLAANSQGVVLALLNRYQDPERPLALSRGTIIPALIGLGTFAPIEAAVRAGDWSKFNPFDLLLLSSSQALLMGWDGIQKSWQRPEIQQSFLHSSSSERLSEVRVHRQKQFEAFSAAFNPAHEPAEQFAKQILLDLHLQQNPDTAPSDIYVRRPRTHSKSICQVLIAPEQTALRYWTEQALGPLDPANPDVDAQIQTWPRLA